MITVSMSGSLRENVGKKDAKKNRREGKVPCVLYGGKEHVHFSLDDKDFKKIIFTPNIYMVALNINGKEYKAILKDVQYHALTDHFLHADFYEVLLDKPFVVSIPLQFTGTAPGVLQGGRLVKKMRKLLIKGLINDMPDHITIDIDKLNIGNSIKVKDIKTDRLTFLDMPNAEIVGVKTARGVSADEIADEEAAAEESAAAATEAAAEAEGEANSE